MTVLPCFHIALVFPLDVTLSAAKGLSLGREMLRYAQHDKITLSRTGWRSAGQGRDDGAAALSHRTRTLRRKQVHAKRCWCTPNLAGAYRGGYSASMDACPVICSGEGT